MRVSRLALAILMWIWPYCVLGGGKTIDTIHTPDTPTADSKIVSKNVKNHNPFTPIEQSEEPSKVTADSASIDTLNNSVDEQAQFFSDLPLDEIYAIGLIQGFNMPMIWLSDSTLNNMVRIHFDSVNSCINLSSTMAKLCTDATTVKAQADKETDETAKNEGDEGVTIVLNELLIGTNITSSLSNPIIMREHSNSE